jgi:hypothetical protein
VLVPYDRILAIDDVGDQIFDGPQMYCRYEKGGPGQGGIGLISPVQRFTSRDFYVENRDDPKRVQKFSPQFRKTTPSK